MYVTLGSDLVDHYLDSIKLLQIIPTGLVKERLICAELRTGWTKRLIFIIFAILNKFCQQCTIICFVCNEKNKNCKTEKKLCDIFCSKVELSSHGMQLWKFAVKITKKEYLTRVFPLQNKKLLFFCETFQFWGIQCS